MRTLRSLGIVAAIGLASTVYAQSPASPQTQPQPVPQRGTESTAPDAASSQHQREATTITTTESAPTGSTEPRAASSQHQRDALPTRQLADAGLTATVGTKVQMSSGESLGEVKEIFRDATGSASYAVISHGGFMGFGAKRTAVPWATVAAVMQGDKLVMERSQLEQAPVLADGQTADASVGTWSRDADQYWRAKVSTRERT